MKKIILTFITIIMGVTLTTAVQAQSAQEKAVKSTIEQFAKAADNSDAAAMDKLLDNNYRIVMNQLFGSKDVAVINKTIYLQKIKSKEWGGDDRKITIHHVNVLGKTASAKVTLAGKATFVSFLELIQDANGAWKLVSDLPTVQ